MMEKAHQISTSTTFGLKPVMFIDNDAIMARLFIGTLKGVAFDLFRSLPPGSVISWIDLEPDFFLVSMRTILR